MPESISFPNALLSLTTSVVTYLGHAHHDPELDDSEVQKHIIGGAYSLHNFASSYWLQLVNRCLYERLSSQYSGELLEQLETLCSTRLSPEYETKSDNNEAPGLTLGNLEQDRPELRQTLVNVQHFYKQASVSFFSLDDGMIIS